MIPRFFLVLYNSDYPHNNVFCPFSSLFCVVLFVSKYASHRASLRIRCALLPPRPRSRHVPGQDLHRAQRTAEPNVLPVVRSIALRRQNPQVVETEEVVLLEQTRLILVKHLAELPVEVENAWLMSDLLLLIYMALTEFAGLKLVICFKTTHGLPVDPNSTKSCFRF